MTHPTPFLPTPDQGRNWCRREELGVESEPTRLCVHLTFCQPSEFQECQMPFDQQPQPFPTLFGVVPPERKLSRKARRRVHARERRVARQRAVFY